MVQAGRGYPGGEGGRREPTLRVALMVFLKRFSSQASFTRAWVDTKTAVRFGNRSL